VFEAARMGATARLAALTSMPPPSRAPHEIAAALAERFLGAERPLRRVVEVALTAEAQSRGEGPGRRGAPVLVVTGPPGAGKRTLVRALAAATGRPLVRVPRRGHGEAGLAGRPPSEGGARPGAILEGCLAAGTLAPLIWLEEVDARDIGQGLAPDDDHALANLADPEARAAFRDRFLDAAVDLSGALVVATARHPARVPESLRRGGAVVRLPGYTAEEKRATLAGAILPRALEALGPAGRAIEASPSALAALATQYAPEAGLAGLARRTDELLRRALAESLLGEAAHARLDEAAVLRLLGPAPAPFQPRRSAEVGVAVGLTWGDDGAEATLVEAVREGPGARSMAATRSSGAARPTGGARAATETALAFVEARSDRLRCDPGSLSDGGFRLRATGPAPSGDDDGNDLAVLLALVSLATDRPVRPDVALAGALSLRGAVRPTAGLPEKVVAALRAGMRKVIVPEADVASLPSSLSARTLASIEIVPVAHAEDAVREALIDIVIAREVR